MTILAVLDREVDPLNNMLSVAVDLKTRINLPKKLLSIEFRVLNGRADMYGKTHLTV